MPKPITEYTYTEIRDIVLQAIRECRLEPGYYYDDDRANWLKISLNGAFYFVEYRFMHTTHTFAYQAEEWRQAA